MQGSIRGRSRAWGASLLSVCLIGILDVPSSATRLAWAPQQKTGGHSKTGAYQSTTAVPPQTPGRGSPSVPAQQTPTSSGNHGADTRPGNNVGGLSSGEDAAIAAGITGVAIGAILLFHHHQEHTMMNPEQLSSNGPKVPGQFDMNHFVVQGYLGPDWPVALDFKLESAGAVQLNIETADHLKYQMMLTNQVDERAISMFHLTGLPDKVQAATFDVEAIAPAGSSGPVPTLRVYGMAAGPKAVGSIAIDQVTFGPANIPMKATAAYGFHSHSDFSNVRADFIYTFMKDNHILMKQEGEDSPGPVAQGARPQGVWTSKGSPGQHMLQIRAWRGYAGDWVVAWSPDVVDVTK